MKEYIEYFTGLQRSYGVCKIDDGYVDPETGKKKKVINQFVYHYSMCTLCNLCILACPTDAIIMDQTFEHAVYDRSLLTQILNKPGSKLDPNVKE